MFDQYIQINKQQIFPRLYSQVRRINSAGVLDRNRSEIATYRLCVTTTKAKQAPFVTPTNYDPNNFIILQRYIDSLIASGQYPSGPPFGRLVDIFLILSGYPPGDKFDMCDSFGSAFTSDAVNLNRNYVNGTDEDRRHIAQDVSDYVLGMLWYILTSPLVPEYTRKIITNIMVYVMINGQKIIIYHHNFMFVKDFV